MASRAATRRQASEPGEGTSVAEFVFNPTNYDTPQLIEVSAVDDRFVEGSHVVFIDHIVSSNDIVYKPIYEGAKPLSLRVSVEEDDDVASVIVDPLETTIAKGGTQQVSVYLGGAPPPGDEVLVKVELPLGQDVGAALKLSTTVLRFNSDDAFTPKRLGVSSVFTARYIGLQTVRLPVTVVSTVTAFQELPKQDLVIYVNDTSIPGLVFREGSNVDLGYAVGPKKLGVSLSTLPSASVTVTLFVGSSTGLPAARNLKEQLDIYPTTFVIEPNGWDTVHEVDLIALSDEPN